MKYLRRFVWYIVSRLTVFVCVLGLMTIAFYFSMNASNIYIILKDGMARRAQVVMMSESREELLKYFSPSYLSRDEVLATMDDGTNPYTRYSITGLDHRLDMEWMWCWPWDDHARAVIKESVPGIDGRILGSFKAVTPESGWVVPRWRSGRYDVMLSRENGRWHIKDMKLIELLESE